MINLQMDDTCKKVPYDQWLITHLDTSWRIKQVKLWFLSKCKLLPPSPSPPSSHLSRVNGHPDVDLDLPRYRPISPITFASARRGSSDGVGRRGGRSSKDGQEEGEARWEGSGEGGSGEGRSSYESYEYAYSYGRNGKRPLHSQKASLSLSS